MILSCLKSTGKNKTHTLDCKSNENRFFHSPWRLLDKLITITLFLCWEEWIKIMHNLTLEVELKIISSMFLTYLIHDFALERFCGLLTLSSLKLMAQNGLHVKQLVYQDSDAFYEFLFNFDTVNI